MDDITLLHRQVHPKFIQDNKVSSQVFEVDPQPVNNIFSSVFVPKDTDRNQLSVYNGEKYSPEDSFNHYIQKLESSGVVSVTLKECEEIQLEAFEDNHPFDGHSFIDFNALGTSQVKIKAKKLKAKAVARDWTFKP